ncbi:hypothetical protein OU798_22540 [Prolixibacteraceae bacterium Z1-6]|uniref:GH16 domain-containing protein n=1 Tax=Draconibacterium aestuarii TaxID=2998507 RepID=A0A9X3F9M0_9BACT|nr:hypothetical protein [Prolixibacteraceae bacterium Z1-6]
MSFKIFSLQLTGKIKPVSTIEKQRKALADDYEEFLKTEASEELKAFLELDKWINSDDFKSKKREVQSLQFKGSEEDNQLKEFERLKKSGRIKKYFKVNGSSDLKKFEQEKESQRMNDYYLLLDFVKEGQFEKEKKEIKSQVFKGSVEEKHWLDFRRFDKSAAIRAYNELEGSDKLKKHKALEETEKFKKYNQLKNVPEHNKETKNEFKALKRDSEIKAYFRFEKSKKLKLYHETVGSHDLKRYNELKKYVSTDEFKKRETYLKDKKKFEKSEAFKKLNEFKKLAADANVKFVLKYEKSSLYKNYLDVKDSFDLKRYFELEKSIQSDEFKKKKAWLEDKKRWEKTEEFKKLQQYDQEKAKPEFVRYFKYKDSNDFDFFKKWEVVFEDDFTAKELDTKKWKTCNPVSEKLLGENYAMPGDLNIFTMGENLKTGNGLVIQVKSERTTGKTWQMPAGFVPTEFDYTSGLITTNSDFALEDGIIEAKINFNPKKEVASAFYLAGEEASPRINLVEMGTKNNVGISKVNGSGKIENSGLEISNLKKGKYIFSVEKVGGTFIWKINETEVWQQSNNDLSKPLQSTASSLVIEKLSGSQTPVNFEIDWVKCYRKK